MELKKYKLGEIADIIGGVAYRPSDICDYGIRILRGGNINSRNIMLKDDDVFLPLSYTDQENQVHFGDTILVASTGSVDVLGKAATCFEEIPFTQIGAFLRIIRPKEQCYTMLISIAVNSEYFAKYIKSQARGTSINNITINYLKEFEIYCPTNYLPICNLYSILENKILLNRKINQNLEAMAKQLYDYWFVQFDFPNEEGMPYKSSGGKMVWNEKLKRKVPEGWSASNICMISDILSGGTPSKASSQYWENGTIPFFGPTDYNGNIFQIETADHITQDGLTHCTSSLFEEGVIIITARGSIGKQVIIGTPMAMNQSCYALRSKTGEYEYLYFLTIQLIECLKAKASGSVFKSIIASDIENSLLCIAESSIITRFCESVRPFLQKIKENIIEISNLTKQRDELLPLLMNGQASVNSDLSAY